MPVTFVETLIPGGSPGYTTLETQVDMLVAGAESISYLSTMRRTWLNGEVVPGDPDSADSVFYGTNDGDSVRTQWRYDADNPTTPNYIPLRPFGGFAGFRPGIYNQQPPFELQSNADPMISGIVGSPPSRITSLTYTIGVGYSYAIASLTLRDRNNVMPYTPSQTGSIAGPVGRLIKLDDVNSFGDWFYPTPTHLSLWGGNPLATPGGRAFVMSSTEPANLRNFTQPFLRSPQATGGYGGTIFFGIGGYPDNDGKRLLESGGYFIRPGAPIVVLPSWGILEGIEGEPLYDILFGNFNNIYDLGFHSAAHGLPPEVEVLYGGPIAGFDPGEPVELRLYLQQIESWNGTINQVTGEPDGIPAPVFLEAFTVSVAEFDQFLLSPTLAANLGTLNPATRGFRYLTILHGTSDLGAFPVEQPVVGGWHKTPCHVQPWAMSSVTDGVSQYMPGHLYDPEA